ncbi:hypothetical protein FPOAC2_04403 [Fusarium poae]|uniref:hypothetical protein n=1 Tax=Fusarium poae TaxID=36050 RepID=UPI001CE8A38D|nr:hypothetical protein FPOAC1_004320 [Fusarium poae]KAG8671083.1 hypothetical protein FPOAC1_004320 [Fusarium poae]
MPDKSLKSFADAQVRKILRHTAYRSNRKVRLTVQWQASADDDATTTATFYEAEVQEVDEDLVLKYWKDAGGRDQATNLGKDRVLKILDEMKRHWVFQWVGYSVEEGSADPKYVMVHKPGAGEAIVKWRRAMSQIQLAAVEDWSIGFEQDSEWPAWSRDLPEVDWDDIDEEELANYDFSY